MGQPFYGEIKLISWNFPPKGWAFCNGQLLPINQNQALFSILGTTYGGNGQTTFALPDLRSRIPIHVGGGHLLGESAGQESHTLQVTEMPGHIHQVVADTEPGGATPSGTSRLAASSGGNLYGPPNNLQPMAANSTTQVGGSQPHTNLQPYLVINFIIALQGIFPSRN